MQQTELLSAPAVRMPCPGIGCHSYTPRPADLSVWGDLAYVDQDERRKLLDLDPLAFEVALQKLRKRIYQRDYMKRYRQRKRQSEEKLTES